MKRLLRTAIVVVTLVVNTLFIGSATAQDAGVSDAGVEAFGEHAASVEDAQARLASLRAEADAIVLIPGPQGEVGPAGPQGDEGPQGELGIGLTPAAASALETDVYDELDSRQIGTEVPEEGFFDVQISRLRNYQWKLQNLLDALEHIEVGAEDIDGNGGG
jgi:hypothetical protein